MFPGADVFHNTVDESVTEGVAQPIWQLFQPRLFLSAVVVLVRMR